jgi:hypothetical protein
MIVAKNKRLKKSTVSLKVTPQIRAEARKAGVPVSTYLARLSPRSKNVEEVTRRGLHLRHSSHDKKHTIAGRNPNEITTPMGGQSGWKRK